MELKKRKPNPEIIDRIVGLLKHLEERDTSLKVPITKLIMDHNVTTYAVNTILRNMNFIEGGMYDYKLIVEPSRENATKFWYTSSEYAQKEREKKYKKEDKEKNHDEFPTDEMEKAVSGGNYYIVRFGKNDKGFVTKFRLFDAETMQKAVQKSNEMQIPIQVFTLKTMFDLKY